MRRAASLVVVRSAYDDRHACVGVVKVPRVVLALCPWTVPLEDFDFERQRTYPVLGFRDRMDAWKFGRFADTPFIRSLREEKYAERLSTILGSWMKGDAS